MSTIAFAGVVAVFAAVCSGLLRKSNREIATLFSVSVVTLILLRILPEIQTLLDTVQELTDTVNFRETFPILIKSLGVVILAKTAVDVCRDAGETAIASGVEFASRLTVLLLGMPILQQLLDLIREVLAL